MDVGKDFYWVQKYFTGGFTPPHHPEAPQGREEVKQGGTVETHPTTEDLNREFHEMFGLQELTDEQLDQMSDETSQKAIPLTGEQGEHNGKR